MQRSLGMTPWQGDCDRQTPPARFPLRVVRADSGAVAMSLRRAIEWSTPLTWVNRASGRPERRPLIADETELVKQTAAATLAKAFEEFPRVCVDDYDRCDVEIRGVLSGYHNRNLDSRRRRDAVVSPDHQKPAHPDRARRAHQLCAGTRGRLAGTAPGAANVRRGHGDADRVGPRHICRVRLLR